VLLPLVLALAVGGPAETISGKYVQHSVEFELRQPAMPHPGFPEHPSIEQLCAKIEYGLHVPASMALLAERLFENGQGELAFRAFHRARELGHTDPAWIESKKDLCPRVPLEVIKSERREATEWVKQLQNFERKQLAEGKDPADLTEFYLLYGSAEDDMGAVMRNRSLSFLGGVFGVVVGLAFGLVSRLLRRKFALVPLLVGIGLALAPMALGQPGILRWGAGTSLAAAALVWMFGRRV
jgi:hypothetical protein